jgi:hypothetical protein
MLVKGFALGSFFCVLTFAVLVIALHIVDPQMNPLSDTISEYVMEPYGYLMTIAFIMRGLGELFLVIGLVLGIAPSSRSWTGLILLALAMVCSFLIAIFPGLVVNLFPGGFQNRSMMIIHSLSAFVGFTSLGIAGLVWSRRFRAGRSWHFSALASLILGLLILFSEISLVLSSTSGFEGLAERVLEVFIVSWLCFVAWRLLMLAAINT